MATPPPLTVVKPADEDFDEHEEFDYRAQIHEANELVATVRRENYGVDEDVGKVERIIKKLEEDLKACETARKTANKKLLGWLRDRHRIQRHEEEVKKTSYFLAQKTNSLYSRSRKYSETFDAILKLKAGNLPDASKKSAGDKLYTPRQDKDLSMGRYKFTGPEIQEACDSLLSLNSILSENNKLFHAHAFFRDVFEDAKTIIERVAGEMYNYPFDALYHRTVILMVTFEVNALIRVAKTFVSNHGTPLGSTKLAVESLKAHLDAGTMYFVTVEKQRARSESGGHEHGFSNEYGEMLDIPATPLPNAFSLEEMREVQTNKYIQELERYGIPEIKELRFLGEQKLKAKSGGYGDIYPVTVDQERSITVAVKVIKHTDVSLKWRAILREAYSWSRALNGHPKEENLYLLPLIGYCLSFTGNDQCPALVSPWCKDGNLLEFVWGKDKKMSTRTKMTLLCDAAQGLKFLHTLAPDPIVHGDLKAANVLIYEGRATLADFGIAKCLDGVKGLTPTGRIWYTERYRPPELQHQHIEYPTPESDMYAFGALIMETLTGLRPFHHLCEARFKEYFEMDKTPADEECRPPNCPPLEEEHWRLMQQCFNFHQHDRPTISESLSTLEGLRDAVKMEDNKEE